MMEENEIRRQTRRQSSFQRNRHIQGLCLTGLLAFVILALTLGGLFSRDREFSEAENRSLAQRPDLTWEAVKDGSYFEDLAAYTADQLPGRDGWMSLQLKFRRLLGKQESGGVYLGEDNYLIQIPGQPNETQLRRNLQAMDAFANANPELNVVAAIVPNAASVLAEKLPDNAPVRDQKEDLRAIDSSLRQVNLVDVSGVLEQHSSEELFYRTDHHWTSLAAAYAFQKIAPALEITAPGLSSYRRYDVSATFEGTLAAKSGSHGVYDRVEIFQPDTDIEYFVKYPDNGREVCSMYSLEALEGKDHYTVFFGGNYPRLDITTTANTKKNLLVFKDSYANCFIQFLYPYYDHITLVDPRYYYDSVQTILTGEGITDVLFLYNLDTFLADASLADTLA